LAEEISHDGSAESRGAEVFERVFTVSTAPYFNVLFSPLELIDTCEHLSYVFNVRRSAVAV